LPQIVVVELTVGFAVSNHAKLADSVGLSFLLKNNVIFHELLEAPDDHLKSLRLL
jgi:hypothetical protein